MTSCPSLSRTEIETAIEHADRQVRRLVLANPDFFPVYTVQGRWAHQGERWTNWCEGFPGGMMWILHGMTGEPEWRRKAEHYSRLIEHRKDDRTVHDLGFLFWPTWKRWFDCDGDPSLRDVVIAAGRTMGLRYMPKGQYLCSFLGPHSVFIDIMMNVGIVLYAALQTGDETLYSKAISHCRTTRRHLVRGDGSTAHEGLFDVQAGEFLRQSTQQGWRSDSTWARGLAWSLYGFSVAYSMAGETAFLDTSRACADFYLAKTISADGSAARCGIPPNDFDDPSEHVPLDSSAAAIAASGLLTLSQLLTDPACSARYRSAALTILHALSRPDYLSVEYPQWEGILLHAVYHQPKGIGVDESVMWGDFFFLEALEKAQALPVEAPQ